MARSGSVGLRSPDRYLRSEAELEARRAALPRPEFPPDLPVSGRREDIARAISAHQVVIVCGETGSGKTTQLPKICLALGRGVAGLIGHTQPRRIAARATAARIAEELKTELGGAVGYKIRFNDRIGPDSYVKLMTDGILLAETQGDPTLSQYDTLIIDEAHERSLNIDFLLGYLKQLLPRRPDLKLIITSATIDAGRFARHFVDDQGALAPVIEVSGRIYPVEVRYRPLEPDDSGELDLDAAIVDAVDELARLGPGDVLVFLPGEREIREAAEALRKHHPPHTEVLPLYSRLTAAEQDRVFRSHTGRRIVLATNVAETSLTVPGIHYVVDVGQARVKRYSYRSKVEQLQVEKISQAAARQRAGRCGRVASGVCIRLYDEADHNGRPAYTDPEILRSSLAAVILRMKSLHIGEVEDFPFIEPPLPRAIADGYALLNELGAVDDNNKLTDTGRQLARLPLDPRIGRMILAARNENALAEVLVIAAALSVQDPRDRPHERAQAADAAHQKFNDEKSDFLAYVKLWAFYGEAQAHNSHRKLARLCHDNFLSFNRMREWRDIHSQLKEMTAELGWKTAAGTASFAQIHRALLTGLLGGIGLKSEEGHYLGARGIRFWVHPGSSLVKKAGRWIMAAELTETTRLYARCVATVDAEWLEGVGGHLVKKNYSEPHWEKKPAHVAAFERASLYGLLLYANRRVHYGPMDPGLSRTLFIREALVDGEYESRAPFFQHNRKLIGDIERLEHKSRRPDVLVDDELIYAFYDSLIPAGIHNGVSFDTWRREAEEKDPKLLFLKREDLMRHEAAGITTEQFPHEIDMAGRKLGLEYLHDPGGARDGVTLTVPLVALNQLPAAACEWLVAGLLKEKVQLLAKSLPQRMRHRLGPLAEFAAAFVAAPRSDVPLVDAISRYARSSLSLVIPLDAFRPELLPPHLSMNFRVLDEHGRQLAMGRSLAQLRAELGAAAGERFAEVVEESAVLSDNEHFTDWRFGDIEELIEIRRGNQTLIGYPVLTDHGDGVSMEVMDDLDKARAVHRLGLRRLFMLALKEQTKFLEKNLAGLRDMALIYATLDFGKTEGTPLREQLIAAAFERACMADPLPATRAQFELRCNEAKSRLNLIANELCRLVGTILAEFQGLQKKLQGARAFAAAVSDIQAQMAQLLVKDFVAVTPFGRLQHFPRYLKAAVLRVDKLRAEPARDARLMTEFTPLYQQWQREDLKHRKARAAHPQLEQFRWLLEELRVQLHAQELRTPAPVSAKRLQKMWQAMER